MQPQGIQPAARYLQHGQKSDKPSGAERREALRKPGVADQTIYKHVRGRHATSRIPRAESLEEQLARLDDEAQSTDIGLDPGFLPAPSPALRPVGWVWNKKLACCGKNEKQCACGDARRYV